MQRRRTALMPVGFPLPVAQRSPNHPRLRPPVQGRQSCHTAPGHSIRFTQMPLAEGCGSGRSVLVERASDASAAAVQDVGVDHRGRDVGVAEEFLDRPDVVAGLEQVCGEAMA